jgi:hypothetical protein
MKEEALKLADQLEDEAKYGECDWTSPRVSATMIRRLVEELDKQEYRRTHEGFSTIIDKVTPQTKPLSDEEIGDCVDDCFGLMALQHKYTYSIDQVQEYGLKLCKAIEERHGIK